MLSASAQSQFQLNQSLTATVGARIDYRTDLKEESTTPRAALVWRSIQQERRIRSGLRLFRAVLAADEDIASKTDSSGALCLTVVTSR
ncbi:MAG TPA: hypothetical protein EYQ31_18045 [Candidatus Handelsmanbacteria bacterium]|nr:hypothetical protein [Candidatus Handelsmanbacteria bacterium]